MVCGGYLRCAVESNKILLIFMETVLSVFLSSVQCNYAPGHCPAERRTCPRSDICGGQKLL